MQHLFLVHLRLLTLQCQLLAHSIVAFPLYFAHLAFFQKALQLMDAGFQVLILFLNKDVFLTHCEQLGLDGVELVSEGLELGFFLLVGSNEAFRILHHRCQIN